MPTAWWITWLAWDIAFGAFDIFVVSKPLGWIFAGIMLAFAVWNAISLVRALRPRFLSPDTDPNFWTRDAP